MRLDPLAAFSHVDCAGDPAHPTPRPPVRPIRRRPGAPGPVDASLVASLRGLDRDGRLLFTTRVLRMFGYGFLAVVLVLYLAAIGIDRGRSGSSSPSRSSATP